METCEALLATFRCTSEHWSLSSISKQEASECIEEIVNENLPKRWHHEFGFRSVRTQNWLPCSSFTVKSKCHKKKGRVCEKKRTLVCGENCGVQKKRPKREAWRRAGRCIENLVRVFGDGWEAWNLNTAPEEVCTGMKLLQSSEKADVRERCQKSKVCDAGQFCETVSARQAVMAMSDLVARVRNKRDSDSATVFLKKRRVFLGGVPNARYGRMWCFSLEELKKFFGVAMCVPLTGLGGGVVRMDVLPIGGLMSKVAASVVLSQEEREWSDNEMRRVSLATTKRDDDGHHWRVAEGTEMTCWWSAVWGVMNASER